MTKDSDINKAFKFIRHAVVKRELEQELKHIHSTGDALQTWNGIVAMNYPVEGLPCFSVASDKLIKAMEVCDFAGDISLTDKTLTVSKASLKIRIPFINEFKPLEPVKGKKVKVPSDFMTKVALLAPFISEDASRGWATSINIDDGMAYVTNNTIIIRTPMDLPNLLLPIDLTFILLKIKDNPNNIIIGDNMLRFSYGKKMWIQGLQKPEAWPKFKEFFDKLADCSPMPKEFAKTLEKLTPFCPDDHITITNGVLSSGEATIEGVDLPDSSFSCLNMRKVLSLMPEMNMEDVRYAIRGSGIEGIMASRV